MFIDLIIGCFNRENREEDRHHQEDRSVDKETNFEWPEIIVLKRNIENRSHNNKKDCKNPNDSEG